MPKDPFFTIILAGYQNEPYLPKCLGSIEQQTFGDFEVLCYVEESTDRSLEICRGVAERDPRFLVLSEPKSGSVSATRNYGIDHARGKYLVVVDGDDWVVPDMLEKIAARLKETGDVDVLAFAAITTTSDEVDWEHGHRSTNFGSRAPTGVFTGIEAIRRTRQNGGPPWLSVYRTAFLRENRLYQRVGLVMEDYEWTPRVWFAAQRFAYLDATLYVYRRRPNSLTTEPSPRIALHMASNFRSLVDFARSRTVPDDIMTIWSNLWLAGIYWYLFHPVTSRKITNEARQQALDILLEGEGRRLLRWIVSRTSLPRRVAYPLLILAAHGFQLPAKFYFRKLYYPLVEMRERRRRSR